MAEIGRMTSRAFRRARSLPSLATCVTAAIFLTCETRNASAQGVDPTSLKSAILFKVLKFTVWPAQAGQAQGTDVAVCFLGKDPMADSFSEITRNEKIETRGILVRRDVAIPKLRECHVAFIGRSERKHLSEFLGTLRTLPILTVSDEENFARRGGMIEFALVERKIQLRVNVDALRQVRLDVSSKVLALSTIVAGESWEPR